jgi:uncharacterized repeat protein (TIGR03803 family)
MRLIETMPDISNMRGRKPICSILCLCIATAIPSRAQTFTTLVNFNYTNGDQPLYGSLVQGTDGNLYGTTEFGGGNSFGTVFKVTPTGTLKTLYSLCAQPNCTDGMYTYAGLVLGTDGKFYGTTYQGGAHGDGTVFSITSGGTLTTLHSFDGTDGGKPIAGLVQATNGNFYGTTFAGGTNGAGTVFTITPSGTLTTLHSFDGTDGQYPYAALIQAANGTFYGTTSFGGANGVGTVFSITPGGMLTTLYSFCAEAGCTDGEFPVAALIQATNDTFYGTASAGGANGYGTVFGITSGGTLTTLHSFDGTDGEFLSGGLLQATNGIFYGTTFGGGANGEGTVFSITSAGTLTTLHSFDSSGDYPEGGLVQATNGNFYGTTVAGGTTGVGTVYSLSVGLGPFVETQPTSGKVGATVKILGTNLTGATSVTFNGMPAVFKVVSGSEITTTVPEGATTGRVKVVTPHGTLSSNVVFRVE